MILGAKGILATYSFFSGFLFLSYIDKHITKRNSTHAKVIAISF